MNGVVDNVSVPALRSSGNSHWPSKKSPAELRGRTENNRVVNFPGSLDLVGRFADLRIVAALPNSLRGEVV